MWHHKSIFIEDQGVQSHQEAPITEDELVEKKILLQKMN